MSTVGGTLGVWDSQDSAEHGQLVEREVRGVNVDSVRARGRGVIAKLDIVDLATVEPILVELSIVYTGLELPIGAFGSTLVL